MTRAELLARISSEELTEWMCYYNLEPFGESQQEYRAALLASVMANTARDEKKHKEPFKPDEFMRDTYLEKEPGQEIDPGKAMMDKAMAIFGPMISKNKKKG
jgi:hypothetical protein